MHKSVVLFSEMLIFQSKHNYNILIHSNIILISIILDERDCVPPVDSSAIKFIEIDFHFSRNKQRISVQEFNIKNTMKFFMTLCAFTLFMLPSHFHPAIYILNLYVSVFVFDLNFCLILFSIYLFFFLCFFPINYFRVNVVRSD